MSQSGIISVSGSIGDPVTPAHGGTGVANPTAHTLPVAEGAANFHFLGPLTNGQLLIGSTAADPVAAAITAGSGITVTNAAGSITIAATVNDPVTPAHGGTGVASPTAHTLPVAEGASNFTFLGPLTNGQLLIGSTGADPVPAAIAAGAGISVTNAAGSITIAATAGDPVTPAHGGTGIASPTAHTLPVAEGASNFTFLGPLTNGQLLIGSTGVDPVPAAITAGAGISVTNAAGSITIAATAGGFTWVTVAGTSQAIAVESAYINANAAQTSYLLPAVASVGDSFIISGYGAGGWLLTQNAGQKLYLGSATTTVGVGGGIGSTNAHDTIEIVCVVANNEFQAVSVIGNITVV